MARGPNISADINVISRLTGNNLFATAGGRQDGDSSDDCDGKKETSHIQLFITVIKFRPHSLVTLEISDVESLSRHLHRMDRSF